MSVLWDCPGFFYGQEEASVTCQDQLSAWGRSRSRPLTIEGALRILFSLQSYYPLMDPEKDLVRLASSLDLMALRVSWLRTSEQSRIPSSMKNEGLAGANFNQNPKLKNQTIEGMDHSKAPLPGNKTICLFGSKITHLETILPFWSLSVDQFPEQEEMRFISSWPDRDACL